MARVEYVLLGEHVTASGNVFNLLNGGVDLIEVAPPATLPMALSLGVVVAVSYDANDTKGALSVGVQVLHPNGQPATKVTLNVDLSPSRLPIAAEMRTVTYLPINLTIPLVEFGHHLVRASVEGQEPAEVSLALVQT